MSKNAVTPEMVRELAARAGRVSSTRKGQKVSGYSAGINPKDWVQSVNPKTGELSVREDGSPVMVNKLYVIDPATGVEDFIRVTDRTAPTVENGEFITIEWAADGTLHYTIGEVESV
jgi:hypothetical protein